MSEVSIQNVQEFQGIDSDRAYLLVLYANKIPPHIAFLDNSKVYSLEVKGLQITEVTEFLRVLKLKKVPTLLIALKKLYPKTEEIFRSYVLSNTVTCLEPVKQTLGCKDVNYIFELVPQLQKSGQINAVSHLNLQNFLNNRQFDFRIYSKKEIFDHISKLNQKVD